MADHTRKCNEHIQAFEQFGTLCSRSFNDSVENSVKREKSAGILVNIISGAFTMSCLFRTQPSVQLNGSSFSGIPNSFSKSVITAVLPCKQSCNPHADVEYSELLMISGQTFAYEDVAILVSVRLVLSAYSTNAQTRPVSNSASSNAGSPFISFIPAGKFSDH